LRSKKSIFWEKSIFGNNLKNNFFSKERFGTFGHTTKRNILGDFEQNRRGSLQNRVEVAWNDPQTKWRKKMGQKYWRNNKVHWRTTLDKQILAHNILRTKWRIMFDLQTLKHKIWRTKFDEQNLNRKIERWNSEAQNSTHSKKNTLTQFESKCVVLY